MKYNVEEDDGFSNVNVHGENRNSAADEMGKKMGWKGTGGQRGDRGCREGTEGAAGFDGRLLSTALEGG